MSADDALRFGGFALGGGGVVMVVAAFTVDCWRHVVAWRRGCGQ